jgi:hypothetical protein
MSTIGAIDVVLSAHSEAFSKGVHKAQEDLDHFSEHAEHAGEKIREHLEGLAGHAEGLGGLLSGSGIESMISGAAESLSGLAGKGAEALSSMGPVGVAIGVVGAAAAAAVVGVVGLGMAIKEIAEAQIETAKQTLITASALGVSSDMLGTLHIAAHRMAVDGGEVDGALRKMEVAISKAAGGSAEAAAAFDRLHLDPEKLAGEGAEKALSDVVNALAHIESQTDRMRSAGDVFGKTGGMAMIKTFADDGVEGMQKLHEASLSTKEVLDNMDSARLVAAGEEWEKFSSRLDGLKNQLTLSLAPYIEVVGQMFLDALPSAQTFANGVITVIREVGHVVALLIDLWHDWGTVAMVVGAAAITPFLPLLAVLYGIEKVAEAVMGATANSSVSAGWDAKMDGLQAKLDAAAGGIKKRMEELGRNMAEGADNWAAAMDEMFESSMKLLELKDKMDQGLDFQRFLAFDGNKLADLGLPVEAIKAIWEAMRDGASDEFIQKMIDSAKSAEGYKQFNEAAAAVKKLHAEMEALQRGLGPEAAKYADPATQQQVQGEVDKLNAMKEQHKAAEEIAKLQNEIAAKRAGIDPKVYQMQQADPEHAAALDRLQQENKMLDERKKILEDIMTPVEKYQEQIGKLDDMLMAGMLTNDQYNKAVAKTQNDFNKSQHHGGDQHVGAEEISQKYVVSAQSPIANDALSVAKQQLDVQTKSYTVNADLARKLGVPPVVVGV